MSQINYTFNDACKMQLTDDKSHLAYRHLPEMFVSGMLHGIMVSMLQGIDLCHVFLQIDFISVMILIQCNFTSNTEQAVLPH